MAKEILDDLKEEQIPHFGNMSFKMLNAGVGFYFVFVFIHLFFWQPFGVGQWLAFAALFSGLAGSALTGLGIYYGIMSVKNKEKGGRKSYFGLAGSIAVFLLMGWMVYGYVLGFVEFIISLGG